MIDHRSVIRTGIHNLKLTILVSPILILMDDWPLPEACIYLLFEDSEDCNHPICLFLRVSFEVFTSFHS